MANTKGNVYPFWGIANDFSVFAVDTDGILHPKSPPGFAFNIGIAEDGTVWALSNLADPDGGGAEIFWTDGSDQWNEITSSAPGGIRLTGGKDANCLYICADRVLRTMGTDGVAQVMYYDKPIHDVDYGGGKLWAILPAVVGETLTLHRAEYAAEPHFDRFSTSIHHPKGLSVNHAGDCYGIDERTAHYYAWDGRTGTAGAGAHGKTINISFKNHNYILTTHANVSGNEVYEWRAIDGGRYVDAGFRAQKILATYHRAED
ncbi:MAG: hypothetical protein AAFW73_12565 [Bacteroidota bacterium]